MIEFFAMGGYAAYVWPALAVTAMVMAGIYIQSHRVLHVREAELDALQQARAEAEPEESHGAET